MFVLMSKNLITMMTLGMDDEELALVRWWGLWNGAPAYWQYLVFFLSILQWGWQWHWVYLWEFPLFIYQHNVLLHNCRCEQTTTRNTHPYTHSCTFIYSSMLMFVHGCVFVIIFAVVFFFVCVELTFLPIWHVRFCHGLTLSLLTSVWFLYFWQKINFL